MAFTLDEIVTFVKVTYIQQVLSGVTTSVAVKEGCDALDSYTKGNTTGAISHTLWATYFLALTVTNEALASKHQKKYLRLRRLFKNNGWNERILEEFSYTWCGRNIAKVASEDEGFGKETQNYFQEKGHRWYHILPD